METAHQYFDWYLAHTAAHWIYLAYTVLLIIEILLGRKARASWRDIAFNYTYLIVLLTILIVLRQWFTTTAETIAKPFGGPYIDLSFDTNGSIWKNVVAYLSFAVVYDFFYYWHHRWQHASPFAWVSHKLHHSDENLGITTSYKHHWTDEALRTFTILVPMSIIFKFEPVTIFLVNYILALQGLMIHMNVNVSFGWFDRITPSPNIHRVHHSKLPMHHDQNFAAVFSFWDWIFGTFHPAEKEAPPTGLDTGEKFETMWRAYFYPAVDWFHMLNARLTRQATSLKK